ncbi:MAG: EamA family transporter [Rhizobiales bacterium]|nr:EamA family transporter [Hyphomicrobiales bacterium]
MTIAVNAGAPDASYRRGVLLVLLAGTCWSIMGVTIRFMEEATAAQILFYRSLALAPVLLVIMAVKSGGNPLAQVARSSSAAVLGGLSLVVASAGGVAAIQLTTVANALFLFASAPFFAAIIARVVLGERQRMATWIALTFALFGITMMVGEGISIGHLEGNLMAALSALGFAVFTVALRSERHVDSLATVFLGAIFSLVATGAFCMASGIGLALSMNDLLLSLGLGIFQMGAGLTLYSLGSRSVPAGELALLSMSEVALGVLWAWLLLGESGGFFTMLGGGLLMAAIAGNALSGMRRRPVPTGIR